MFSIFPCDWNLPRRKPIKNLADHHFPPRTVIISRPTPAPVRKPVVNTIPACEMLKPGEEIDTAEIDKLWADLNDDSSDTKGRQMMQMISMINEKLDKNIKVLQDSAVVDDGTVSKEDLLKLLQGFKNYSQTLENYFKEQTPSLL